MAGTWEFDRAVARIESVVDPIVADHATSFWRLPYRRREMAMPSLGTQGRGLVWTIDHETVLEWRFDGRGPSTLVVHDFGLFEPLKKVLRTRHVRVRHATVLDK
jgi:hypothetical protein